MTNVIHSIRFHLSERFRLVFEDPGVRDMLEKEDQSGADEAVKASSPGASDSAEPDGTAELEATDSCIWTCFPVLTLKTSDKMQTPAEEPEEDEFAAEAKKYRVLLRKIDQLLERLKLDA